MRKIILLLSLLCLALSQELVVKSWTGSYDTGSQYSTTFQNCQNNNVVEIAVYGWFKVSSQYSRSQWATIFHLTSNSDATFTDSSKAGDRVLAFFNINNNLHTPTYTTGNANYYTSDPTLDNADLDKWAFFYVGTGNNKKYAYFSLPSSGVKTNVLTNIVHSPSNYYKLFIGQSASFKYFAGSLFNVNIKFGTGAYRESGYEFLITSNPNTPAIPGCGQLFTEKSYSGRTLNKIANESHQDVKKIKSIYVPEGEKITVIDNTNFAGKRIIFNRSIDNINQENWDNLVQSKAITIISDNKNNLKRNNNQKLM